MWQERADYGHFFYRIPNGESAADAYDRVSGFNESLWRSFGEDDFASVCVLVTHGLMARVFLMKWYHFSVEYFEDLKNINHCEFVVMRLNAENGKYALQNHLRTWSEMKRERASSRAEPLSLVPVRKRWGGCQDGDRGDDFARRQHARRQNTADLFRDDLSEERVEQATKRVAVRPMTLSQAENNRPSEAGADVLGNVEDGGSQTDAATVRNTVPPSARKRILSPSRLDIVKGGRDGGGSRSGATSPNPSASDDSDAEAKQHLRSLPPRRSMAMAMALKGKFDGNGAVKERVRADALGDQSDAEDEEEQRQLEKLEAADKSFGGSVH